MGEKDIHYTRQVHPAMGLLGLMCLLGPISYSLTHEPFMLAFIGFIGLFGLYFEGKMSNTLKSEQYIYNKEKANLVSFKFAFAASIISMLLSFKISNIVVAYTFLIGFLSLMWGLTLLLSQYLLYKYDCEEKSEGV